jgi:hypothetical protein
MRIIIDVTSEDGRVNLRTHIDQPSANQDEELISMMFILGGQAASALFAAKKMRDLGVLYSRSADLDPTMWPGIAIFTQLLSRRRSHGMGLPGISPN